jgi:hypothetical protein
MFVLDENLRQFATEAQWRKLKAVAEHGSMRSAARALGIDHVGIVRAKAAVENRAAKQGYAPGYDLVHPIPDGYKLKGASTLYRSETGEPIVQWIKTDVDRERQEAIFREAVEAFASAIPRIKPSKGPQHANDKTMAVYPVGDHHLGMLSWDEETGDNYDLGIGERLLMGATDYLLGATPPCEQATVVFLGDFMHYDSFEAVTPTSRNMLDADGRYPKMVRAAIRSMRYLIEAAAQRHRQVHVVVEIGNHDLSSSIFLMECLSNIYEKEPRITVDTSPKHYHYFDFGACLVGTHHGHGAKMEQLPLVMATDRPEQWGRTKFRYWYTGHIHHRKSASTVPQSQDYSGCVVESFRVLCPTDAWAAQKGYRQIRDMKAILLHREFGEVARHTVNPDMF